MRPGARSRSPTELSTFCPPGHPPPYCWQRSHPDKCSDLPDRSAKSRSPIWRRRRSGLPTVPRLTGPQDTTAEIQALHPDLIIDYGTVSPRYKQLAQETQKKTGIPTLLFDGALDQIPAVARTLGQILHQPDQAEADCPCRRGDPGAADPAEAHPSVYYARGADGLQATAPNTDVTAIFARLGWRVVAPDGTGTFRPTTVDTIRTLDPDIIILADPEAKDVLAKAPWSGLRAVRELACLYRAA